MPVLVYAVTLVVLALTTSGYFGSKPRYLLPAAFPLLFPVAWWLAVRPRWVTATGLAAAAVGSAYAAVWLLGPGPP